MDEVRHVVSCASLQQRIDLIGGDSLEKFAQY